jgi:ubiquitin conjugation factor E4 B
MADEHTPTPPPPEPQDEDMQVEQPDADKVGNCSDRAPKRTADASLDQIRAKRLAKLGGPTSTIPSSSSPSPKPVEAQAPQAPNPFAQLGMKPDEVPKPRINIKSKAAQPTSGTGVSQPVAKTHEVSIESWEDRTISGIFRITLDQSRAQDVHGHKLYFASSAKSDLEEEGRPLRFTTDMLDSVLLESASSHKLGTALEYLLGCWKRVAKLFKSTPNKADPKHEIVKEARRLCFSYCVFAATMPDMFGEEGSATNALADHLLLGPDNDQGICFDFLAEASARISEDDTVRDALVGAIEDISQRLSRVSMNGDYRPFMLVLQLFIRFPSLITALAQADSFLPAEIQAQDIELNTLLGPFFRLSPMQGEVALNYFAGSATQDKGVIANAQRALRMTLQTHQEELFDITNAFIKNKESREKMLDWFALTVNKNHMRRAIQVDHKVVSTDGFMVNVTVTLDRLCEPFMDATFSKIDRIEVDYLRRSPRVDITDETKINADDQASEAFYNSPADGKNNFISEVYRKTSSGYRKSWRRWRPSDTSTP